MQPTSQNLFADSGSVTCTAFGTTYTRPIYLGANETVDFQWFWTGTPNIINIQLQTSNVADPNPAGLTGTVAGTNNYFHSIDDSNWTSSPITISGTLQVANGSRDESFNPVGGLWARLKFNHGGMTGSPVFTGYGIAKP